MVISVRTKTIVKVKMAMAMAEAINKHIYKAPNKKKKNYILI